VSHIQAVKKLIQSAPAPLAARTAKFCASVLVDAGSARNAASAPAAALALYTDALAVAPCYHAALFHVGVLAHEAGRTDDARALYELAVASEPSDVQVCFVVMLST
jgi:tetratricopeptide (TPR) repeat protein